MPDQELRVKILAEDKATGVLQEVEDSVQAIEKNSDLVIDVDLKGLKPSDLKQIASDLDKAGEKAKALGAETVTIRVKADDIETVQRAMGDLAADARKLDSETVEITVKTTDLDSVKQSLGQTREAADGAKSALANMIGNSVQDLGSLGGVAGSTGVAIGQMAEYMADAAAKGMSLGAVLQGFAPVVGPIAALGLGIAAFTAFQHDAAQFSEDTAKAVSDLAAAIREADGSARTALQKNAMVEWLKEVPATGQSVIDALDTISLDFNDVADAIDGRVSPALQKNLDLLAGWNKIASQITGGSDAHTAAYRKYAASLGLTTDQLDKLLPATALVKAEIDGQTTIVKDAIDQNGKYERVIGDVVDADKASADAKKAAADAAEDAAKADQKYRESVTATVLAVENLVVAFDDAEEAQKNFGGTFSANAQEAFDVHQTYADVVEATDDFAKSIKELGPEFRKQHGHLTTFTEDGRKALDATQKLAKSVGDELAETLDRSGGDYEALRQRAAELRDEVTKKLIAGGVDPTEVENYLQFLRLSKPELEVDIKVSQQKTVKEIVDRLLPTAQDAINANPDLLVPWQLAVAKGDVNAQLAIVAAAVAQGDPNNPVVLAVLAQIPPDQQAAFIEQVNQLIKRAPGTFTLTPVAPTMDQIMKSADPETASWLAGGLTSAPKVTFTSDLNGDGLVSGAAEFRAKEELDAVDFTSSLDLKGAEASAAAFRRKEEADKIVIPVEFRPINTPTSNVPAGATPTGVPTAITIRQTINAGFGTDRFALERAVRKANRHTERLAGVRR